MTGGFALIAYPARYCSSGVKSFIVNQDGMVYQKDLGQNSRDAAHALKARSRSELGPGALGITPLVDLRKPAISWKSPPPVHNSLIITFSPSGSLPRCPHRYPVRRSSEIRGLASPVP